MTSEEDNTANEIETRSNTTDDDEEDCRRMRDVETDLEQVEAQLQHSSDRQPTAAAAGRAVFNSIRSTLGSIRTRLENRDQQRRHHHHHDASRTPAVASAAGSGGHSSSNDVATNLAERLRRAELAHATRMPLNLLHGELTRRQQQESENTMSSSSHSFGGGSSSSRKKPRDSMEGKMADDDDASALKSPRRDPVLLASRRKAEQAEGPQVDMDLHGTGSVLKASVKDIGDGFEIFPADATMKEAGDDDDVHSIVLPMRSQSNLELSHHKVLFDSKTNLDHMDVDSPKDTAAAAPPPSATVVYSWGRGMNLLHDDAEDVSMDKAQVSTSSRVGRTNILSCAAGKYHSACTTSSGQVLIVGRNTSGEVDPNRKDDMLIHRPTCLESLGQASIVQVSCGLNHTAALRANGTVLTWGGNEHGQLGHRLPNGSSRTKFIRPAAMMLGPGNRAKAVACGDGFTLCLTSRMQLFACGVQDIAFDDADAKERQPKAISALENLPLVAVAAGRRHAVVATAHGTAFAWGDNATGACGREYPEKLAVPVPIVLSSNLPSDQNDMDLPPPLSNWEYHNDERSLAWIPDDIAVSQVACGDDHTVLVTRSGGLFLCGKNNHGQVGVDASKYKMVGNPTHVAHPDSGRIFVNAACGESHTLLLDDFSDVWQIGGHDKGSSCTPVVVNQFVQSIAAGGSSSLAIALAPDQAPPRREFSDTLSSTIIEPLLVDSVEQLVHDAESSTDTSKEAAETKIAARTEELFRTPAVLNSLFMDPTELEDLFSSVLNVEKLDFRKRMSFAVERGMFRGLESLRADEIRLIWPEQVRFLLLYLQCPFFVEWKSDAVVFDRRGDLILSLCDTLLGIPYDGYRALMVWATSVYPRERFVRLLVKPLLSQLEKCLSVEAGAERRPIPHIVSVLRWLYNASERAGNIAKPEDFYCEAIGRMDPELLYSDLRAFRNASKHQRASGFFFCDNPFLFAPTTKRNLLQIENEVNMLKTATAGVTYNYQEGAYQFDPYFVLAVDREHLLPQTLQHLSRSQPSDLRKKLRVVFKGEDGVDAGGVTREYFLLLSAQLFDWNTGMWSTRFEDGQITWFNSDCSWNDEGYYLTGVLVGLAVYNSVLLDVHFPQAVYRKLLGLPLGLEDMVDEGIKSGLQQLLDYEGDDVEEVFCLTFDVNWTDLGIEKRKELKPNGAKIPVTSDNKEEYVMLYVRWLLVESIYPQYESFLAGFMKIMVESTLDLLRPEELELLVAGSAELDFEALEKNAEYEGGYSADSDVVINFWRFVKNAPAETQLNLLKFVTGSTKAPIGGLGSLKFKIQRAGPDSNHLPTSHTCFNTLLLPDYGRNKDKLEELLGRAVIECEGFGLQ